MKRLACSAAMLATATLATATFAVFAEFAPSLALAAPAPQPQAPAPPVTLALAPGAPPSGFFPAAAPPPPFTAWDWAGAFLAADVGGLAGGAAGVGVLIAVAQANDGLFNASPAGAILGLISIPTLTSAGAAAGAYAYGSLRGHRGAYWAALGGSTMGSLATLGVAAGTFGFGNDRMATRVTGVAAFILPALGATVGYYLSREAAPRPAMGSAALLDLGRDGRLRLQLPALAVAPQRAPKRMGVAVSVPLFGGAL